MKIDEFLPKTVIFILEFIFTISIVLCSTVQELDSELDLSLVTPYEIKPTCSNCSNTNMTLFSDSFLQFNQDTSLKNLIRNPDNNEDVNTLESIDIESEFTNTTTSVEKVELALSATNFTNGSIFINTSVAINNNNRSDQILSSNSSVNINQTQINHNNSKINATNSSIILVTLKSTEMTLTQKIKNEVTSPDIESNGFLLSISNTFIFSLCTGRPRF